MKNEKIIKLGEQNSNLNNQTTITPPISFHVRKD